MSGLQRAAGDQAPLPSDLVARLTTNLSATRTPLSVAGLALSTAAAVLFLAADDPPLITTIVLGIFGVNFLVFGQVFAFLSQIPRQSRSTYVLVLFSLFVALTTVIFLGSVYFIFNAKNDVSLPIPPIAMSSKSVINLPADLVTQKPLFPESQLSAESLDSSHGRISRDLRGYGSRQGYPNTGTETPKYVEYKSTPDVSLHVDGVVWTTHGAVGRFAVVSSGKSTYFVDHLYLHVHKYQTCSLRDEQQVVAAPNVVSSYAFFISEHYNVYEFTPRVQFGELGNWKLNANDFDNFAFRLEYPPYVLYIVTINAVGRKGDTQEKFHIRSPLLPLLRVRDGNFGGCLDLNRWYSIEKLQNPNPQVYSYSIEPAGIYQLLTLDAQRDRNFLKTFVITTSGSEIDDALEKMRQISRQRPENTVFKQNLSWLGKLNSWKLDGGTEDPP